MLTPMKVRIKGVAPLIMHNGQLANPANKWVQAMKPITSKRKKTEEDYEEIARLEWHGGLYLHKGRPAIPAAVLCSAVIDGAKKNKNGKLFKSSVFVSDPAPVKYKGPTAPDAMWESGDFWDFRTVRVGTARVMRSRPRFDDWSCQFELLYNQSYVDSAVIKDALSEAQVLGLCDFRPQYGRFEVVSCR